MGATGPLAKHLPTGQLRRMSLDEMVDGQGGLRPPWRRLMSAIAELGRDVLAERAARLERLAAEAGATGMIQGAATAPPLDPLPLILGGAEFAALADGLAQRASVIEAMLADLYGPQTLLADGALPPEAVFADPGFLRPCHHLDQPPPAPLLRWYAADLARGADGSFTVLADHTGLPDGLGQAIDNRRTLGRTVPELFAGQPIAAHDGFLDAMLGVIRDAMPPDAAEPAGVALLTRGHADPAWFGQLVLARELSCALVEGGDLTVREGALFLKTLRGLQPIGVLLRGVPGAALDPLQLAAGTEGVAGLLAVPPERLAILNHPGAALAEAAGLRAALPSLAPRLIGAPLRLAGAATVAEPATVPWLAGETLEAEPYRLRLFLARTHDGWRALRGGLARRMADPAATSAAAPAAMKDVWVLSETEAAAEGAAAGRVPRLAIRRDAGALPSRVADNFFWFGRYLERLEAGAFLLRIALIRAASPAPTPHEAAETEVLIDCLTHAGLVDAERVRGLGPARLAQALPEAAARQGAISRGLAEVSRLIFLLRDRLTAQMHLLATAGLREARAALGRIDTRNEATLLERIGQALSAVQALSAMLSGLAAENMVRGGGWLFLDLGRRVERAGAIAAQLAAALAFPGAARQPARVEHGLRLALELCDSTITYRARYLALVQPGPVLDLLLADPDNPRGLAFQLAGAEADLAAIAAGESGLAPIAASLRAEAGAMLGGIAAAADPAAAAAALPPRLRALAEAVGQLSDQITRRYFALLAASLTDGMAA